jgi:ribosomal protein L29
MKKSELKQLIKEEIDNTLNESPNTQSFEMYKKSIRDLVNYIKLNDIEKDAEGFFQKNMDKRLTPFFSVSSNDINKMLRGFQQLK